MRDNNETHSNINLKVYVAIAEGCGEFEEEVWTLGVYSTFERAQEVALNYKNRASGIYVHEVNIDGQQLELDDPIWLWDCRCKEGKFLK